MKITSVNNELIKKYTKLQQKKYRDSEKLFLLEGEKCVYEAINSGISIENIFVIEGYSFKNLILEPVEVTEAIMQKLSTTTTPPKIIAVANQPAFEINDNANRVLLLEDIKDAGNLGTILRTASAFCFDAIVLYGDTVDLFNPKCVRAAVGNLWKTPVIQIKQFEELKTRFNHYTRIATLPKSKESIWVNDYKNDDKILVMFGTESSGLSEELKTFATKNLTIEMSKEVESLNLSISAGIIMYKIFTNK